MAVLAIFTGKGFTKEMYESLKPEVNWETNHPDGAIFHAAAFDNEGNIHVADVWESGEKTNAFVGGRLMPAFQKLDIPAPEVNVYPAHNINAYSETIDQYKI